MLNLDRKSTDNESTGVPQVRVADNRDTTPFAPPRDRGRAAGRETGESAAEMAFTTANLSVCYGDLRAVRDARLSIESTKYRALIGRSGCFSSTGRRTFNGMTALAPSARADGQVFFKVL